MGGTRAGAWRQEAFDGAGPGGRSMLQAVTAVTEERNTGS